MRGVRENPHDDNTLRVTVYEFSRQMSRQRRFGPPETETFKLNSDDSLSFRQPHTLACFVTHTPTHLLGSRRIWGCRGACLSGHLKEQSRVGDYTA